MTDAPAHVWLDGRIVPIAEARIDPADAGFLHAAGAFTTMRAKHGVVFRLADHLARLRDTGRHMLVPLPYDDDELAAAAGEVLAANNLRDARLRLTLTAGPPVTEPGSGNLKPTVLLTAAEAVERPPEHYERGIAVALEDKYKLNPFTLTAGHKALDYVARFAALRSAAGRGCGEALWFSIHNFLQCGSVSNVFVVKDGALVTPPTEADLKDATVRERCPYDRGDVLPGVTRKVVLELAGAAGVPTVRAGIDVHFLYAADEIFLTNSVLGVMPVTKMEARDLGEPGPITRQLRAAYLDLVERETNTAA